MFFIKFISHLPLSILYLLSDFLYFLLYHVIQYRKKVVFNNLKIAFPDHSEAEHSRVARDFYKNLSDIIVETIKAYSISPAALTRRIKISNIELINEYYKKQVPIIVMTSHLCNWEWLLISNCILLDYEVDGVYKKLNNKAFEKFMKEMRGRFGANMIEKNNLIRTIAQRRNIPRIIAMVSDQTPASSPTNKYYPFFGREIPFYTGAEKIAQMTKYPVLFVSMTRLSRGQYEVTFEKLADPPYTENQDITSKYVSMVEKEIRKNPENWLWSHKRWKHQKSVKL
ncbi:MAG TPA: lysophospholipid acyltransferase family protein [Cytophagales bacterium]|nr:lysophospholipid acyltransferase family protein [Cytophagales bacterium]